MVACPVVVGECSFPIAHWHVHSQGRRGRQLEFGSDVEGHNHVMPEWHLDEDNVWVRSLRDYVRSPRYHGCQLTLDKPPTWYFTIP